MGSRNIRCTSNFRVSAFSDLHRKNKKLSSNEWIDRPLDKGKTCLRYRRKQTDGLAFYPGPGALHKIDTAIDFVKIERKRQKTGAVEYGIFGYRR